MVWGFLLSPGFVINDFIYVFFLVLQSSSLGIGGGGNLEILSCVYVCTLANSVDNRRHATKRVISLRSDQSAKIKHLPGQKYN